MFRRITFIFILLAAVATISAQDKTSIAVWDFEAMGLNSQEVDILSRRVVSLLVSTNQYIVTRFHYVFGGYIIPPRIIWLTH